MAEIVETAAGRVAGAEQRGIRVFRGIPFARPPVGPHRFRPPEPPEPWSGVRDARAAGAAAPQPTLPGPLARLLPSASAGFSEDCLTLSLWTPGCDDARRPVLVWIHGGAFVFGTGSAPLYAGRRLARRGDVVVVTVNYRLGALGFLPMTDVTGPEGPFASNLGVRDQIAALRWVRENVAAFGGDPRNVTLVGESAGAMSVGTLLGTPAARGLFHRAILQSGAASNCSGREDARRVAEAFLEELGLAPATAERLRETPVEALLAAQQRTSLRLGIAHGTLPWQPACDGELLPEPPLAAIAAGAAKDVPVLVGTNRDEWKLFLLGDRKGRRLDEAGLRRRLARVLHAEGPGGEAVVDEALALYREGRRGRPAAPPGRWCAFQGDRIFHWPAARLAERQSAWQRETYLYRFDWAPPLLRRRVGACHALEIPLLFGSWRHPLLRPLYVPAGTVRRLSRTVQQLWTSFARHGDPNHGLFPDWPAYDAARRATMRIDTASEVMLAPREAERRFWQERDEGPPPARGD